HRSAACSEKPPVRSEGATSHSVSSHCPASTSTHTAASRGGLRLTARKSIASTGSANSRATTSHTSHRQLVVARGQNQLVSSSKSSPQTIRYCVKAMYAHIIA